jgi:predicted nucleic acid-binding protein
MDIILDSSVWFEYFKGNSQYKDEVQGLLNILSIKIIDPIIGEILQGALSNKEVNFIKTYFNYIPKITIKDLFVKAGEFSFKNKLISKGIGLIDASIIYATLETNSKLWTLNKKILRSIDKKYLYN